MLKMMFDFQENIDPVAKMKTRVGKSYGKWFEMNAFFYILDVFFPA